MPKGVEHISPLLVPAFLLVIHSKTGIEADAMGMGHIQGQKLCKLMRTGNHKKNTPPPSRKRNVFRGFAFLLALMRHCRMSRAGVEPATFAFGVGPK